MKSAEIDVIDIAEFSNSSGFLSKDFAAMNETILAGILANSSDSRELNELERLAIKSFDMVVVNVCPFEKISFESADADEVLSKIDIAGVAILRAGAKNYKNVTVIVDKVDYYVALNANDFGRLKLAVKAFNFTANYDRLICSKLAEQTGEKPFKTFNFEKLKDMKYGENPHKKNLQDRNQKLLYKLHIKIDLKQPHKVLYDE